MYDPEAIEAMSTPELARLLDRLSERELKSVLIFMTGAAPRTVAHALNFVKDGGAETLVRQSGRAAGPAPVITDSERTCNEVNPDGSGEHCYRGGDHGVHRDPNGDEWRTDLGVADDGRTYSDEPASVTA